MAQQAILLNTKDQVRQFVAKARAAGNIIALVPTMGAIHSGHQSLVERARAEGASTVIASVFVNPTQFAPGEDYEAYPRTLDEDLIKLGEAGTAAVFAPSVSEMYGQATIDQATIDQTMIGQATIDQAMIETTENTGQALLDSICHPVAGSAARLWEGAERPSHFDGVVTVVSKLFNIVRPDLACFGEKDFQQLSVIRQMVEDMDMGIRIVACPIARDSDGLAISSRNRYLDPEQRKRALSLSAALRKASAMFADGCCDAKELSRAMHQILNDADVVVDYAEIVDAQTLNPVSDLSGTSGKSLRAIIAARVDHVRLIDNSSLS